MLFILTWTVVLPLITTGTVCAILEYVSQRV